MSAFIPPNVTLDPAIDLGLRTLPGLVDYNAEKNPHHLFCIQVEKDTKAVEISYEKFQRAIACCQTWLRNLAIDIHPTTFHTNGGIQKCSPVAILMESHVGLAMHVLALMGLGCPVVLLSARLSAAAVRHLIGETGAKFIIVSPRLQRLAAEAFPTAGARKRKADEDNNEVAISIAAEYQQLLEEGQSQPASPTAHANHYVSEEDRQVLILHSSGTSGLPKPIPCSHRYFLGYATCHNFDSDEIAHGLTVSTMPFFHGFGFVCICMSLSIGKTICIPPPSTIPNGASIADLIHDFGAKALLTVPSILEEIENLPDHKGHAALRNLDFVAFGGGIPKQSTGESLVAGGVRLINQYGATEAGAMTPFFIPGPGYDWRRLRLRSDTLKPLQVRLDRVETEIEQGSGTNGTNPEPRFTYKLSMRPFGWRERFELQDLIVTRRECSLDSDIGQLDFTIAGRTDDLICLATGEKVRPTILESLLIQQAGVKAVTAFGDQQFELGVIVEPVEDMDPNQREDFKASIWPAVVEAGLLMDAHARITSPTSILVVPPNALPRSDKGTILRNIVAKKFEKEIADVYRNREASAIAPALDLTSPSTSIRLLASEVTKWHVSESDWLDEDDFFARGMDSLQATQLRRFLAASIRAASATPTVGVENMLPIEKITADFIYAHPSVTKLAGAVVTGGSATNGIISEADLIEQLVDRYSGRTHHVRPLQKVVVLTGATGSLGSFVLQSLLLDETIQRVVCLNRSGKANPIEAQKQAAASRGIPFDAHLWEKVEVCQTSTAAPYLGLGEDLYNRLALEMSHVVHIAWPMNFMMGLKSFDASFKTLQNLIDLARKAHFHNPQAKPRLLFISSVSTVGNYPLVQGRTLVPEVPVDDPKWTLDLGYGKAKLVCEKIIERATQDYPEIETGLIRVGQIAGANSGYWNANEHFVAVCASSQKIGKFPDLRGTFSWLPVDLAANAITEILFNKSSLHQIYHLENPVRQKWEQAVSLISKELQIPASSVVPLDQWLDSVASASPPGNPALGLIHFLRNDFLKMSCGSIVLDVNVSRSASHTMANMKPVGENTIKSYLSYWKRIKVLK